MRRLSPCSTERMIVTENHGVGGSIPPLGTIVFKTLAESDQKLVE